MPSTDTTRTWTQAVRGNEVTLTENGSSLTVSSGQSAFTFAAEDGSVIDAVAGFGGHDVFAATKLGEMLVENQRESHLRITRGSFLDSLSSTFSFLRREEEMEAEMEGEDPVERPRPDKYDRLLQSAQEVGDDEQDILRWLREHDLEDDIDPRGFSPEFADAFTAIVDAGRQR